MKQAARRIRAVALNLAAWVLGLVLLMLAGLVRAVSLVAMMVLVALIKTVSLPILIEVAALVMWARDHSLAKLKKGVRLAVRIRAMSLSCPKDTRFLMKTSAR